jgi:hypothetical protein
MSVLRFIKIISYNMSVQKMDRSGIHQAGKQALDPDAEDQVFDMPGPHFCFFNLSRVASVFMVPLDNRSKNTDVRFPCYLVAGL